ncbi:acyltransferase family protein [Streptomyces sp. 4N509B]|uniref:acyltransferase family protein n=1 Tax=Streptomyces sp. 4N509B TaxID=3457413 RepID=UPI003FD46739
MRPRDARSRPRCWTGERTRRRVRSGRTAREAHWDTTRYVAGTLVLFVHVAGPLTTLDGVRWLYVATWALRVPAFALLAGYFSDAGPLTPRGLRALMLPIVVPYLAVGLLHTLERRWATGEWRLFLDEPAWAMWFLLSLLCWRLALPYLARLRHPLALAVGAALCAGFLPADVGGTLQLSRTLCFLPFFLLGWRLREGLLARPMRAEWSRFAALAVLGTVFVAAWPLRDEVRPAWLQMRLPYETPSEVLIRVCVLLVGAAVTLSFVRLVPRRRLPFVTYLGAGGMYIYLLHPLALRLLTHAGIDYAWVGPWPEQAALLALAALLAAALASPPVRLLTRPIIQPARPRRRPPPPDRRDRPTAPTPTTPDAAR